VTTNGFWTDILFDGLAWLFRRAGYTVLTKDETLNIQQRIADLTDAVAAVAAAEAAAPGTISDAVSTNVIAALPTPQPILDAIAAVNAALAQATRAAADGQAADLSLLQDAQTKLVAIQDTLGPAPV
jgi:hypothetical protein